MAVPPWYYQGFFFSIGNVEDCLKTIVCITCNVLCLQAENIYNDEEPGITADELEALGM